MDAKNASIAANDHNAIDIIRVLLLVAVPEEIGRSKECRGDDIQQLRPSRRTANQCHVQGVAQVQSPQGIPP